MAFSHTIKNSWVAKILFVVIVVSAAVGLLPSVSSAFVSGKDINCKVVFPPLNLPLPDDCDDEDEGGSDDDGETGGENNGGDGDEITPPADNTSNSNGGGHGGSRKKAVLGASTDEMCSTPLITTYLGLGKQNDLADTVKLQVFLNKELGLTMPTTGTFNLETKAAVEQFQLKYADDVLLPWVPFGLASKETSTGYVYKTTQRMINKIYCASLEIPMPQLP